MKSLLLLFVSAVILSAADLTVNISGIAGEKGGDLQIFLYKKSNWMKLKEPTRSFALSKKQKDTTVVLKDVIPGEYAIRLVHDENRDGKLTMKWLPPGPTEGYGFSSGYKPGGIPKYKPAAFEIEKDMIMSIGMIYPQ